MIPNEKTQHHYDFEVNTAKLVRYCYHSKCSGKNLTPMKLYELCRLTWHDKLIRTREQRKWKALWVIGDKEGDCPEIRDVDEFGKHRFPPEMVSLARNDTGFVGFYQAFRNSSYDWIVKHFNSVAPLVHEVANLKDDAVARKILERIDKLERIPRPKSPKGPIHPKSLLTPLFACLDPRWRFPIINRNDSVVKLHKQLGIACSSLPEQFDVLIQQIGQRGIEDALMLDVSSSDLADQLRPDGRKSPPTSNPPFRPLNIKGEDDVNILLKQRNSKSSRLHNKMTNSLRKQCIESAINVSQQRYDALISNYDKGRDLLIEAKSSTDRPSLRLAVGQLLDYRRALPRRAVTDLAVLLPKKPEEDALAYLSDIGIRTLWFTDANLIKIKGTVELRLIPGTGLKPARPTAGGSEF